MKTWKQNYLRFVNSCCVKVPVCRVLVPCSPHYTKDSNSHNDWFVHDPRLVNLLYRGCSWLNRFLSSIKFWFCDRHSGLLNVSAARERHERQEDNDAGTQLFPWSHPSCSNGPLLDKHPSQSPLLSTLARVPLARLPFTKARWNGA